MADSSGGENGRANCNGAGGGGGCEEDEEVGLLTLIGRSISWHFEGASSAGPGSHGREESGGAKEETATAVAGKNSKGEATLFQMAKSNTMSGFRSIGSSVRQLQQRPPVQHQPNAASERGSDCGPAGAGSSGSGSVSGSGGGRDGSWIMPKKYAPTGHMKSRALGQLDPSIYLSEGADELYEQPAGHSGRLWFVLNYSKDTELLAVTVAKARNLQAAGREPSGQPGGDCYVRVSLEGVERRVHTTAVKRKTNNPNFDEKFTFQIPMASLESQLLQLTVCHIDKQRRHKPLGYAHYPLCDLLSFGKDCRIFRDLECAQLDATDSTEVRVSLTHHALMQRITVGLHECRNLPVREDDQPMELYLRVSFNTGMQGREIKSKRTEAVTSGVFNESLIFNRFTDVGQSTIRVALMQRCSGIGALFDRCLGSVVLGPELFTKGRELEHWREMADNPEQPIVYWHAFSSAAE